MRVIAGRWRPGRLLYFSAVRLSFGCRRIINLIKVCNLATEQWIKVFCSRTPAAGWPRLGTLVVLLDRRCGNLTGSRCQWTYLAVWLWAPNPYRPVLRIGHDQQANDDDIEALFMCGYVSVRLLYG